MNGRATHDRHMTATTTGTDRDGPRRDNTPRLRFPRSAAHSGTALNKAERLGRGS